MALQKANIASGHFVPRFNAHPADINNPPVPAVLDGFEVIVGYQIVDDDGTATPVSKSIDIWPLLNGAQQAALRNLVTALINAATARA